MLKHKKCENNGRARYTVDQISHKKQKYKRNATSRLATLEI